MHRECRRQETHHDQLISSNGFWTAVFQLQLMSDMMDDGHPYIRRNNPPPFLVKFLKVGWVGWDGWKIQGPALPLVA